jgi:hypothetical protein
MRAELAERVLARVMEWDETEVRGRVQQLQALAGHKYDEYGGYQPGVQFLESLASWLFQFDPARREAAVEFVLKRLVFISDAEMDHLIAVAYPDLIRPLLAGRVAADLDVPRYRIRYITSSTAFRALQRRTLVLGLSDGAKLDRLRRASKELSHEQFHLVATMPPKVVADMRNELQKALGKLGCDEPNTFRHILLVDDFAGSGFTLIRKSDVGFEGKLPKMRDELDRLRTEGAVPADVQVSVLLYIASDQAITHVRNCLAEAGMEWQLLVVQPLESRFRVDATDPGMVELCRDYYDPVVTDEHKGEATLGFRDAALPLVLSHNTPNDSVCLLWADTTERPDSRRLRALFPRYERHHPDRP